MLEEMASLVAEAPIRTLVNTHGDGDHWFGNELVGGQEIVATDAAAAHEMRAVTPGSMVALRRLGVALELAGRSPIPYPTRGAVGSSGRFLRGMVGPYEHRGISLTRPTRTFSGRLELDVGGRKVELIEVEPAHTHGDLIVHVPDARVVFAADVAFVGSTPVMWVGPLEGWLRALGTIEALEPQVVVPGHGPVTDVAGLATLRGYWAYLDAAARPRLAGGLPATAVARGVVTSDECSAQPFASWECPERAVINVHTLDRHRRGGSEPRGPAVVGILGAVGRLAAELPGRAPAALHPRGLATDSRSLITPWLDSPCHPPHAALRQVSGALLLCATGGSGKGRLRLANNPVSTEAGEVQPCLPPSSRSAPPCSTRCA